MPTLKQVQAKIPSADTVAGRVLAYHNGKHYDIGEYVGDGAVHLNKTGEELLNPPAEEAKVAPVKAKKGLDLDKLEV